MLKALLCLCTIIVFLNGAQMLPPFFANKNSWAEDTLKSLSLKEKIGQLFIVAAASKSVADQPEALASSMRACPYNLDENYVEKMIQNYHVGGVIFLYKSDPETQMALAKRFQIKSKTPLLVTQDCEWGLSMRLDLDPTKVVRYPRNMTLGALADEDLIYQVGYEIGKQCAAIGVHMNFAPVSDVNNNHKNPVIHDRSFGDDPIRVARLAALFAQGLQDAGVIACAKHFPGHGDTDVDSHLDLPVIKHAKERLNAIELVPFKKLIDSGVGGVMMAHLAIPELDSTPNKPSSMSYAIVTQELKNNLKFKGLVITDGLGMEAITKHYKPGELELEALLAGNDILLCPLDVPRATKLIIKAIKSGRISEADLDARVLKILKAKAWAFQKQEKYSHSAAKKFIVRPEAYILQKAVYQNAVTLVKGSKAIPFNDEMLSTSCIIQIGAMPENVLIKKFKKHDHFVNSFTALFSEEELQTCLQTSKNSNTVIIGVSQLNKFAQKNFGIAHNTEALITTLKQMGKNVVVIIFGTPYCIKNFKSADVIIEAYEDAVPAQEAVVDVLRGVLPARGKLPVKYD